jgi:hypothetical protein
MRLSMKSILPVPESPLFFVKKCAQWQPKDSYKLLPRGIRGIYALLNRKGRSNIYNVAYIGMAARSSGIRSRLRRHFSSKRKEWTHFSLFEVWENIREETVDELEGLFREIYRKDERANLFNRQRRFKKLRLTRRKSCKNWNPN